MDGIALAYYVYIKDELEVVQVEELYSVCEKKKIITKKSPLFAPSPILEHSFTERVQLNISDGEIEPLKKFDKIIHVGDSVKLA